MVEDTVTTGVRNKLFLTKVTTEVNGKKSNQNFTKLTTRDARQNRKNIMATTTVVARQSAKKF